MPDKFQFRWERIVDPTAEMRDQFVKVMDHADGGVMYYWKASNGLIREDREGRWFAADWDDLAEPNPWEQKKVAVEVSVGWRMIVVAIVVLSALAGLTFLGR